MNEKRGDQTVNICGTNIAQNKYRKRPNKLRNRVMSHNNPPTEMPADCKIQKALRGSLKLFINVPGGPKDAQTLGYGPLPTGVCVSPRDLA